MLGQLRFALNRFLIAVPTVFLVLSVTFFLIRGIGNPIAVAYAGRLSEEELARRIAKAGFDQPLITQYRDYLLALFRGDLGTAITTDQKITQLIKVYLPASMELAFLSLLLAIFIALPLGAWLSKRANSSIDNFIRSSSIVVYSIPVFLSATLLKILFSVWIPLFPSNGRASILTSVRLAQLEHTTNFYFYDSLRYLDFSAFIDVTRHAVLPAFSLAIIIAALLLRIVRANFLENYAKENVLYAKSLGISQKIIRNAYVAKPSGPVIITSIGLYFVAVITGVIYTEKTFEWQGLGYLLTKFILDRDYTAVQGLIIFLTLLVVIINLVTDAIAGYLNPKIKVNS